jgi:biopolymer transport protein ExbD
MPVKLPVTDEAVLNMTPMIDIVFNLVTFFMLTLDMSQKELAVLDLPRATNGIEDKDPSTDPDRPYEEKQRFVVNLEPGGSIYFKGTRWSLAEDPVAQDAALEALRQELRKLTRDPRLRNADGTSKAMVMVRGDRTAKFKYIQWIMQVCADPNVQIFKLHFAVEHKREQ